MLKSAYTGAGLTVGHTPETDEEEEGYKHTGKGGRFGWRTR